jgi:chromosome partitioning protein
MTTIICITNQKGGVAKTTTTVHLAHGLARLGKKVLIVDFDPQGQSATTLGIDPQPGVFNLLLNRQAQIVGSGRPNLHILPGDPSTATAQIVINAENRSLSAIQDAIQRFAHEYQYILFDTAPSAGGIQERAIFASHAVLIPTSTEFLSSDGMMKGVELINKLREERGWNGSMLGILPTFYDEQTNISRETLAQLREQFGDYVLAPIHRATIFRDCAAEGRTVFESNPLHRSASEYAALVESVLKRT